MHTFIKSMAQNIIIFQYNTLKSRIEWLSFYRTTNMMRILSLLSQVIKQNDFFFNLDFSQLFILFQLSVKLQGQSNIYNSMKKQNNRQAQSQSILLSKGYIACSKSQANNCGCHQKIEQLNDKLQLMTLKIQQLQSNLNLEYAKHMECFVKISDIQKKEQELQYLVWEIKQILRAQKENHVKLRKNNNNEFKFMKQDIEAVNKLVRSFAHNKAKNDISSSFSKELQCFQSQVNQKIKLLTSTVEDIGLLQRKMLQKQKQKPRCSVKSYLGKSNDTTMIGNSYYY